MPSFRCKIKKLRFQGILTEKETERILDALDKTEKPRTDGDLISRNYIIQQIQKAKESNYNFNYNTLIDFIKVLPSAEKTTISAEKNNYKTTITDGDLISRKAVIDLLNRLIEVERKQGTDVMNYGRERVNAYESILDEIESDYLFPSMPSAEKTDGDLIPRKSVITMLNKIEIAVEDGDGFQFNEWVEYAKDIPSAEKTDRVITELEKITESIKEIKGDNKYVVSDYMCGAYEAFDVVFDIIKDRIAELKGDKKWESVKY